MLIQVADLDSRLSRAGVYDLPIADIDRNMADAASSEKYQISGAELRLAAPGSVVILGTGRTIERNSKVLENLLRKPAAIDAAAGRQIISAVDIGANANPRYRILHQRAPACADRSLRRAAGRTAAGATRTAGTGT